MSVYYIDEDGNLSIKKRTAVNGTKQVESNEAKWLKGGAFADGWQFGDLTKTILGTTRDVKENVTHAVLEATENLIDTTAFGVGQVAGWFGADGFRDNVGEFIAKDPLTKGKMGAKLNKILDFTTPEGLISKVIMGDNTEGNSVLGDKADGLVQSGAHLVGSKALQMVGVPSAVTMGVNAFGSEIEQAYKNDATHNEALISGAVAAAAEILIEKISSGIKFGGKTLDEGATKTLSRNISNRIVRSILKWTGDTVGEGLEEYLTESATNVARKLTYADEMTWKDVFASEEHLDAFVGGAIMGGAAGGYNAAQAGVNGVEYASGLTANEEKVVRHEYEKRVAEKTKNGEKVDKAKIWDEVIEDMEKGYISTDTIEEVLGDKSYDNLKQEADEFNTLYNKEGGMSKAQQDRLAELEAKNKTKPYKALLEETKKKQAESVRSTVRFDRLRESYLEADRAYQDFQIDPDKYKGRKHEDAAKKTIQSAIDSGANNTNRVHDLVEMAASVSADTGRAFSFKSGEQIKADFIARQQSEIAKLESLKNRTAEQDAELAKMKELLAKVESGEVIIDGDISADGIVLNLDSNKPLNRVVGHEITHHFEPGNKNSKYYTELRDSLFAYAKTIGRDIDAELAAKKAQYAGVANANAEAELVADLVGDFLFTDNNYINQLSVEHQGIFKKLWNEIKYLCKMAAPGSKEYKALARVQKAFEDIYREGGQATQTTQNSLSSIANTFFGDENMTAEQFQKADYRQTQGYKDYVEQCVDNLRQSDPNFDESVARQEIESSIDGIVQVAIAAKQAGYDIYDDASKRDVRDSKNRLLFSSLEPNSDYFTSNDISTICDKHKNFSDIYAEIVKAEEAKSVPTGKRFFDNVDNYFAIHKIMADKGLTTPCRQCYVNSMRKNLAPMANAFLKLVNETDADNTANDQLWQKAKKDAEKYITDAYGKRWTQKESNAHIRESVLTSLDEYGMSVSDLTVETLTTPEGLAQLKIQAPNIYEAFNSFYGQSKPKMERDATPFRFGELTALLTNSNGKINENLVKRINSTGGFRLQSYSDFQIQNFTDVLQVLFEAGTLGLKGHAYTKVPAFLEATEGTNLKRNFSIFMYKDGNKWKLDKNDSFPYSLEEIYDIVKADKSGNTGIIAVSQNADMSAWIMANDFIAYGIPFHKSGLKMGTVRDTDVTTDDGRVIKGYSSTIDHTKQQSEVYRNTQKKVKKGINIYSFWDFNNKSNLSKNKLIEKNVKNYIDACEEAGYLPKFRAYVMDNGKVLNDVLKYSKELGFVGENATIEDISFQYKGYTIPYGYYKFLGDFGMFTPDGKASPQNTLSLKNYDFDKAVQFFAESETLRRNEILQQFANGAEREKYRESNLTAEQLQDIVKSKRGEVVQDVVSRHASSLSNDGDVFAPSKNDIYGKDFRMQEIAPVQETAPAQEESVAPVAKKSAETIRVYRGFNKSRNASEKNLTPNKTVYDYTGKQDPNNIENVIPLSYYTESFEDAQSYADMDKRMLENYRKAGIAEYRQKVMEGRDMGGVSELEYAEQAALNTFRLLHGGEPNLSGYVESYDYTPGKTLDLTKLGDVTDVASAYRVLSKSLGISELELDDYLMLEGAFEDEFYPFSLLRNTPSNNIGTRVVELAKKAGYDNIRYSEDGNSHYAIINDIDGAENRIFLTQDISPVSKNDTSTFPDDLAPAEETNIDSLTDEDAPMGDIAPVRVLVRKKINKPMKTVKPDDSTGAAPSGFDPVSHLQYEYGSLPVGENPVREDSLPKSTTGKDKVSLTARTVKGAEATPDEFVDLLDKEVVGGRFSYLPIKNTDTVKKAYDSIVQKGWEAARGEWESRVRRGEVSAELSATGELLLNNAAKAGDRKAWLSILHDYQIMGTNAGQAIQAMRILKTLTPDDGLYMIERSVEQMVEDMKLGTEIVIDEDLKQKYLDAKADSEKDAALDALAENVASQIPSTAMDKWTALRYLNMLGNLRTQVRNISGNLGMSLTSRVKNTIAATIEAIAEKASGGKFKRTKSAFVGRGLLKASKNDFANVEQVALNGGKFNDSMAKSVQFQQKVQDSRKIFNGIFMPLEQYRRATNWAMSQGDLVFSKAAYGRALAGYLKANGITETDFSKIDQQTLDEARAYAVKEAQEVTFRDNNWLSDWVSKMGRRKDTPKVGKLISEGVMPFRKTPANILLRAEEYSPLGILNATAKSIKAVKGDISGAEVVNSWAKALTGTGLFALGMLLNNLGVLSGGPDDDENKEQFENQYGQQNYSLKIGEYSFTIDFLSPSAMPLLMGAQLNELRQDKDVELKDLETSLMSIADPMIEMSMLQGVNDSLDNIRYAESNMGQFLVNSCVNYLTQGLTNSFLGQLERSFEGERMTTYIDKDSKTPQWLQKALGKASAKTPVWDYQQVPYVDAWGETEDIAPLPGALENTLSPSYISHEMTDDVYEELNRLNDAQSDINVYPQTPNKTVTFDDADGNRHVDYNLTAEEYVELSQLQGQTQKELVEDIMSSELYDGLTDKEKAKAVQLAYQYAREYSRQEVLGADGFSSKWMSEAGDDIVNAIIAHVSDEKTFAYNYPEKYSFFMSNGISYEQYASADEAGKRAYTWAYENPGKYKMYQKLSGDYMTFYGYKSDLNGIKSDKDTSGNSITGSRKKKVVDYIDNMDADYGDKIILYKSEYPSDDTYNNDIVEYLNSRNDISYDDMVTILKELGFTVDKNGNVSW